MLLTPPSLSGYRDQASRPVWVSSQRPEKVSSAAHAPVRFAGLGDVVSAFIGLIDSNRAAELIASDGLGMLLPRTAVAAGYRGGDDARETLIREGAGLFCVAMLAGLSNQLMIHVLGNRVGVYNPHGTPAKAWISAKNLRVYSELYQRSLDKANSMPDARQAFISSVLDGLESGDRHLSLDGRLIALKNLSRQSPAQAEQALAQMVQDLRGQAASPREQQAYKALLQVGNMDGLRGKFLANGWGRLSAAGKQVLLQHFEQKPLNGAGVSGTSPIDQLAWARVNEVEPHAFAEVRRVAFLKTRLRLALNHLHRDTPEFAKAVDELALNHGLTSVVQLKDGAGAEAKVLSGGQSRQTVLKELKAFLEHYVDRAGFEVNESLKRSGSGSIGWKQAIHNKLFAKSSQGLRGLFPQAKDGFVTAMLKAKSGYTLVPIAVAIIANGITTFMNNYITRKKYGGRVFFPGEEAFIKRQSSPTAVTAPRQGRLA